MGYLREDAPMIVTIDYVLPIPDFDNITNDDVVAWFAFDGDTHPLRIDVQDIYNPSTLVAYARRQFPDRAWDEQYHFGVQLKSTVADIYGHEQG